MKMVLICYPLVVFFSRFRSVVESHLLAFVIFPIRKIYLSLYWPISHRQAHSLHLTFKTKSQLEKDTFFVLFDLGAFPWTQTQTQSMDLILCHMWKLFARTLIPVFFESANHAWYSLLFLWIFVFSSRCCCCCVFAFGTAILLRLKPNRSFFTWYKWWQSILQWVWRKKIQWYVMALWDSLSRL